MSYHTYLNGGVNTIPSDSEIAQSLIDAIEMRKKDSPIFDYASEILANNRYENKEVDAIINLPKDMLNDILDHPTQEPANDRMSRLLEDMSIVAAVMTVQNDREFIASVQRSDAHILRAATDIMEDVERRLIEIGKIKPQNGKSMGGYSPGGYQREAPPVSAASSRPGRSALAREVPKPTYEPKVEREVITKSKRPLVRAKGYYMDNDVLCYRDHATFNNLALASRDVKPEPDFFGVLATGSTDTDSNYLTAQVSDVYAADISHAQSIAWTAVMTTNPKAKTTSTVLDIDYSTVKLLTVFSTPTEREEAVLVLGTASQLFDGSINRFDQLYTELNVLKEVAESSDLADTLFRTLNRRATVALNKMIRYELTLENLSMSDFSTDFMDLRDYLVRAAGEANVVAEFTRLQSSIVTRILSVVLVDEDVPKECIDSPYSKELLSQSVALIERHFCVQVPISASALGIALDDRVSYVCPMETTNTYDYLSGIIRRAEVGMTFNNWESISLVTIDGTRFDIGKTDIEVKLHKSSPRRYLTLTFRDYQ